MNPFAQLISLPHTLLQQLTTASHMRQMQNNNAGFTQTDFVGVPVRSQATTATPLNCQTLTSRISGLFQPLRQQQPDKPPQ